MTRSRRALVLHLAVAATSVVGCRSHAATPGGDAKQVASDVPEIRQRSSLDCGPAALQAVLQGFGVQVSYEKLVDLLAPDSREGASIDKVEEVANRLGVAAQQVMLPVDHLFLQGTHSGPMIAIANAAGALKHFLVLWRISGDRVQVMDPASGARSWVDQTELRKRLYVHQMAVPANAWKEWSHGEEFHTCLFERMRRVGLPASDMNRLWADALSDSSLMGLQALDAAVRLAAARPGRTDVLAELQRVFGCSRRSSCTGKDRAPQEFWSAWDGGTDSNGEPQVTIRGVVLVNFGNLAPGRH